MKEEENLSKGLVELHSKLEAGILLQGWQYFYTGDKIEDLNKQWTKSQSTLKDECTHCSAI